MLNKFKGCLVGLAVGDYLGMPVEFCKPFQVKQFYPNGLEPKSCTRGNSSYPAGFYTDDTAMAICLAESLIEKGFDIKDQFLRYRKWLMEGYATPFGDKAYGVGQNTLRQLFTADPDSLPTKLVHKENQGGNGALMRCAPLALAYYKNEEELFNKTLESTIITHNNEMAVWSCIVHNCFISYSLLNINKNGFIEKFITTYTNCPVLIQKILKADFNNLHCIHTGYTLNTLAISLSCFFTTENFKDCLTKAIYLGGDTDTQGAVAGSLAGTYYGEDKIPSHWKHTLIGKNNIVNTAKELILLRLLH